MIKFKVHSIYLLAALPLTGIVQRVSAQQPLRKPNVVFIYADDIGFGDLSCNGAKTVHTPNVEQLATLGVRFTNMHSTAATCTPSRYSLLTGEYAWRREGTGIATGDAGSIIRPERFTLADLFKNSGYRTAVVGKWHLGLGDKKGSQDWNGLITPGPSALGFDYSFLIPATGDRVPCVFVENERVVHLDPNDPIAVSYEKNFEGEPTGKLNPELLRMHPSHGHNMSIVNGISRIGYMKGGKSALWKDEEIGDVITGKALNFIEKSKNEPFFLYFATHDVHVPRVPNPRFAGKSGMGPRGDAILEFDWSVGEVLKTLKRLGIEKNTIIIVTSDNGPVVDDGYKDQAVELLGAHKPAGKYRGGKYSSFEGGTLTQLAKIGYKNVEHANYVNRKFYGYTAAEFKKILDDLGLKMPSGHTAMHKDHWDAGKKMFSDSWKYTIEDAAFLGQKYVVSPSMEESMRQSYDDMIRYMDVFNLCGELCQKSGMKFSYHNHSFEFSQKLNNVKVFDIMMQKMDPKLVVMQLDIGNMYIAGAKALDILGQYPGRFELMHVKDEIAVNTPEKYESTILGTGIIPTKEVIDLGRKKGGTSCFIIEQESYQNLTPLESVRKDFEIIKKWGY